MSILAFGINHKTASVGLRSKVAFDIQRLGEALHSLQQVEGISESVILSTCNRTEIYCSGADDINIPLLIAWLAEHHSVDVEELSACSFNFKDQDAVMHLMRVASGLDSLVLGEPQILGQLKTAYVHALESSSVSGQLNRLFEHCFSVAKRIRTETAVGENSVSVAAAAVKMAGQLFSDLKQSTALLIGAGKTTELVARHLNQSGIRKLIIANRTLSKAQELSRVVGGEAAMLGDIPDILIDVDIVIASTSSDLPILGKGAVERALKARKHRPFFMVDIAIPMDIEPQVGDLPDVYLYNVDDLKNVIDENLKSREYAAQEAELLIREGCANFVSQQRASNVGDALRQFRVQAESLQKQELEKALNALKNGRDAEAVLSQFSHSLTKKLIHEPTIQVRKAAERGQNQKAVWLLDLFGITPAEDLDAEDV